VDRAVPGAILTRINRAGTARSAFPSQKRIRAPATPSADALYPPNKPKNQEAFGLLPQLSQHLHFWPHLSAQHLPLQQVVVVAQDDFVLHIEAQPVRSDALKAKERKRYFTVLK